MTDALRAYVEKVAGWTMLEDEYNAETPEGEMLRDQYDDIEEYRSDIDDDRLLSDFADLQGLIGEARGLLAHVTPDASPSAPQTPDASALMLAALRLAAERIEMNNYGGEEDEALAEIKAAIAGAEGRA